MAVNLTLMATEAPAVVYFADGSSVSVPPQEERSVQIPDGDFCTISSTAAANDEAEHIPPEERALAFAERMVSFWVELADKAREAAQQPQATPV